MKNKKRPLDIVVVLPYDEGQGVFWKLQNKKNRVVEYGFDSTADAEMWAFDNNYAVVSSFLKKS